MLTTEEIIGQPLALLLIGEDDRGEDEWWLVYGTLANTDDGFAFVRAKDGAGVPLESEWLERIKSVTPQQTGICKPSLFYLPLSVGPIPENADPAEYVRTGLRLGD